VYIINGWHQQYHLKPLFIKIVITRVKGLCCIIKPLTNDKEIEKMTRKNIITTMILVLFISILACGSNSNIEVKPPDSGEGIAPPPTIAPTTPPLGTSRNNPAPVGSVVLADDMNFVILSSTRPATDIVMAGNIFNTEPEAGQEYIFVELQATCTKPSDQQCSLSTFNLKLVGSSGIERDAEWFVSGVDGLLEDSEFYGGASVSGQIPFIVNQDETNLLLVYEPWFGDVFYLAIQ
jgi:hypothetical protein